MIRRPPRSTPFPTRRSSDLTESMRLCDVVLPAATQFEVHDLYGAYGHHWLQRAEPVIPPPGEALPNTEIFRRLDRKSTRLNSSHANISYAVFCLKKTTTPTR